jgi:hypothetical protein
MSTTCVDAAVELANESETPLMLIASRRQIDSEEFGGGYVNNWTSASLSRYVLDRDRKGKVLLARDHGGPWQNNVEVAANMGLREAMESAKSSLRADLEAGFQMLHLDPSVDIHGTPNVDEILERLFELYEFAWKKAKQLNREVIFEIGTEEQSGSTNSQEELEYTLSEVFEFCRKSRLPKPSFVVIQAGTKVMETMNIGSFDCPIRVAEEIPAEIQVPKMIEICQRFGIFMKAHNTDYMSDEALQWYPRLGIHAANVAPEFGVVETVALIEVLEGCGLNDLTERFLDLAFNSGKWKKWMLTPTQAGDREKAVIAGHYVFSSEEGIEIKREAELNLDARGIDLNAVLKAAVKKAIARYLRLFRCSSHV